MSVTMGLLFYLTNVNVIGAGEKRKKLLLSQLLLLLPLLYTASTVTPLFWVHM